MQKLLLDEMMPVKLEKCFPDEWEASTVRSNGWLNNSNGALQRLAVAAGFGAMLTLDKNMRHQVPEPLMPVLVLRNCPQNFDAIKIRIPMIVEFLARAPAVGYHDLSL